MRSKIPAEPPVPAPVPGGSATKNAGDVAVVRFQLPQSSKASKLQRRFNKTDTVEDIYNYLSVFFHDEKTGIVKFVVSTNFPKVDLTDMTQTLDEVVSDHCSSMTTLLLYSNNICVLCCVLSFREFILAGHCS